jgi:RNA polymerase sigma-70 factor (ECF subfamily)
MAERADERTRAPGPRSDDTHHRLAEAVRRAQDGDEQAFRQVYRIVQPRLLNYVRALVGEAEAEDVASEAWLGIARDLRSFRGDASGFLGWTATIARHRATDHLRRRRPVVPVPHEQLPHRATLQDTAGQVEERLGTEAALALIGRLPPDQAQAILLRVIMGLDSTTAARVLGKRPGAVRTAAHRGLRTLTEHLPRSDHPPHPRTEDGRDQGPAAGRGAGTGPPLLGILKPAKPGG